MSRLDDDEIERGVWPRLKAAGIDVTLHTLISAVRAADAHRRDERTAPPQAADAASSFLENWQAHFMHVVDEAIMRAGGDKAMGRREVAAALEKDEQTIYQHYFRKSRKRHPSWQMMVLLEKKYGHGRPAGWAAQAPEFQASIMSADTLQEPGTTANR